MQLKGIPAIVTGGASGLGGATAELFATSGAKVTIFDLNEEKGRALAEKIGGLFVKVNASSEEDVIAGLDAGEKAHGVARVLASPDIKERFLEAGVETFGTPPDQLAAMVKSEVIKLGKVIRDAGIKEN